MAEETNIAKCHQKIIKEKTYQEDLRVYGNLFNRSIDEYVLTTEKPSNEIKKFIEKYEWMGTWGVNPRWVFTARIDGVLACVVCMNVPNAYSSSLLNIDTKDMECLIQRGASSSFAHQHIGSKLIRYACNWMAKNTSKKIFVAYSDPQAGEIGTIYSACGFEWLGWKFGTNFMYKHKSFKNGKLFSSQSLKRTSQIKKWYKEDFNKNLPIEIINPESGFKSMAKIDELYPEIRVWLNEKIKKIISESEKIPQDPKGKWILVLGKDKREQRDLNSKKIYKSLPKPKRNY